MESGHHVSDLVFLSHFLVGMFVTGSRDMKFAVQKISGMMKQRHGSSPHYLRVRHWLFDLNYQTKTELIIKVAKECLITKMVPSEFISLEEFHSQMVRPGEEVTLYLYNLKRLLPQAMPELAENAHQPLLLHQFLSRLLDAISQQLAMWHLGM